MREANTYWNISPDGSIEEIDVFKPKIYDRGKDYYIDIFRVIEERQALGGLQFYISENPPSELPHYGQDVVLVLVSDEAFQAQWYFPDLCAVLRTYSWRPTYGYGIPSNLTKMSAFVQFIYKYAQFFLSRLKCVIKRRDLAIFSFQAKVLHTPLGTFFRFTPKIRPISERSLNYAFLGSVEYSQGNRRWQHALLKPPKLASRADLLTAIDQYSKIHGDPGKVATTNDFEESVKKQDRYVLTLENCKISLCPRGSNAETYRYFESCLAGCIVICEPLPHSWFYTDSPAIVVQDWSELPRLLQDLLNNSSRMQELSAKTRAYAEQALGANAVAAKIISFVGSQLARQG